MLKFHLSNDLNKFVIRLATRIQHETKFSRKFHGARGWNNEEKRNES